MDTQTQSHQELHYAAGLTNFDPLYDPRWQNIYQPQTDSSNFDFMHYRQTEDALSSASSSSDGSYAHSIYSASSDLGNPLNVSILRFQTSYSLCRFLVSPP